MSPLFRIRLPRTMILAKILKMFSTTFLHHSFSPLIQEILHFHTPKRQSINHHILSDKTLISSSKMHLMNSTIQSKNKVTDWKTLLIIKSLNIDLPSPLKKRLKLLHMPRKLKKLKAQSRLILSCMIKLVLFNQSIRLPKNRNKKLNLLRHLFANLIHRISSF